MKTKANIWKYLGGECESIHVYMQAYWPRSILLVKTARLVDSQTDVPYKPYLGYHSLSYNVSTSQGAKVNCQVCGFQLTGVWLHTASSTKCIVNPANTSCCMHAGHVLRSTAYRL